MLEPEIENRLFDIIAKCIRAELEVYRAYPKKKKSKEFRLSADQKQYKEDMDMLLAKAIVFGVREPKEALKARKKR